MQVWASNSHGNGCCGNHRTKGEVIHEGTGKLALITGALLHDIGKVLFRCHGRKEESIQNLGIDG